MVDLVTLAETLGVDMGEAPSVHEEHCLNRRFRQRACTICQDVCPVHAIRVDLGSTYGLNPPRVTLDETVCARCGLCLHACPAGAFTHPGLPEYQRRLHRAAARLTSIPLELACPARPGETTTAPVEARLQTGRCLAALSLADLIDLARPREHDLWLDDAGCAACPLGAVHEEIARTVEQANRLLDAWGHPARVHLSVGATHASPQNAEKHVAPDVGAQPAVPQDDASDVASVEARHAVPQEGANNVTSEGTQRSVPVYDARQPALSRRELITFLRDAAARAALAAAQDLVPPVPDPSPLPPHQRLGHYLPYHRRHLTAALQRLGKPVQEIVRLDDLPWTVVQVGEACSACQLCARFCPTAAIRYHVVEEEGQDHFLLTFVPPDCVDCGICALACPEDAITYTDFIYTDWLVTREEALLHRGKLVACEDCGQPTAEADPAVCYTCKPRRSRSRPLI